jgi:hypothetical protein
VRRELVCAFVAAAKIGTRSAAAACHHRISAGDGAMGRSRRVGTALDSAYADITSWMAVPLALKDRVIGMLALSPRAGRVQ